MNHAEQVSELEHDGERFALEQRIAFNVQVWTCNRAWAERREATIHELWIEDLHGKPMPYAECLSAAGEYHRVWFHRDKVGYPMGVTGKPLEGAMF